MCESDKSNECNRKNDKIKYRKKETSGEVNLVRKIGQIFNSTIFNF